MPKVKTCSAAKKRFKVTATGRLLRRPTMRAHKMEKKSSKRKRRFRKEISVTGSDVREVKKMLGSR